MNFALTHGWLPILVQTVTAGVLVVAIGWRSRRWRRVWIPLAAGLGAVLALAAHWFIDYEAIADDSAPWFLWWWIALSGLVIAVAASGWRTATWWRRGASLVAIPLCVGCVALTVDAWTGYLPTVGSLWNRAAEKPLPSQVDEATVQHMREHREIPHTGVLVSVRIPDTGSGFPHRDELVYLPPAWFAGDAPPPLPALVMAGGEFGRPSDWPDSGEAQRTADDFAARHGGNAPLLVFVDTGGRFSNDTECVNGVRGNAADHLTKDVVPYVESHFTVSPESAHWGIVGWSAGGTCAITTTVMHPDVFSTFLDIDGQLRPNAGSEDQTIDRLFGGDAAAYRAFDPTAVMTVRGPFTGVAGWFAVSGPGQPMYRAAGTAPAPGPDGGAGLGPEDHLGVANYLCSLASSSGIECSVVPQGGDHDFGDAAKAFAAALPWLAGRLGTPAANPVPLPGGPGAG
ncbi:alpha/beta hydrolase [Mycobacterium sp. URHB0021]